MLQSMGSARVGHDWPTELKDTVHVIVLVVQSCPSLRPHAPPGTAIYNSAFLSHVLICKVFFYCK